MSTDDIRWIQRLHNFGKVIALLTEAVELAEQRELSDLEKLGLVQVFKYNYELAWNTLKDFLEAQGETNIFGSRDAFQLAFRRGLIEEGEIWMDMIKSRALTTHTYNEETAEKIASSVRTVYYPEFVKLHAKLEALKKEE
ncbi:MAG: nucleotidyltransferase substrate binding protein [Nitrospirae bacterium]|nr:nucleotidyltransferase substrate binding protein [Nitrospirota bacterium]